ncbi:MAG TPA: hypothetical protein VK970_10715 [Candidatus Methylacidiphilales bacterium]|nr:hypothetical protein [Candidatus Methylacidiphilales bacterium]
MNAPLLHPQSRCHRTGAALIIVLAFVVLLTALVLAYFSYINQQMQISNASASQVNVRIFLNGAVNTIVSDLKQEIFAGSTNLTYSGQTVSYPLTATNMVPARVGTADSLPNLTKRSVAGTPFYVGGISRAAALPSTTASLNGRSFSLARWNAALLLPRANTASAADLSPIAAFTAPDWVLVARDGSNPTAWNANMHWSSQNSATVVGRYAYTIYDEGGLLDANAAGYPPGALPEMIRDKGGLAFADMTAIPGMTTEAIAALVGWRNYASSQPVGSFPAYTFGAGSQTNYFNAVQANTSGFLQTAGSSLVNGQSDRMFLSRQQLIQFLTQGVAANASEKASLQNALQYLCTFTRDLEQPSFRPDPKRPKNTTHDWASSTTDGKGYGGNDAFDTTGAKQDQINPAMLSVRAADGQPVMKRRFPLSRIALLKVPASGPTPEAAAKILDYFGLTWDVASRRWNYDHGTPNQILKLSEIPAGREPDFFETLKASINCDSIAKQYGGTGSTTPGATISPRVYISGAAAMDGVVNYQIIQIGANIIDQYDADSFPTVIAFTPLRIYCGVENLPYLAGWMHSWYRMKKLTAADIAPAKQPPKDSGGASVFPFETWTMYQPILWNPHAPDAALDTAQVPTSFRVAAGSMTGVPVTVYPITRPAWWPSSTFGRYPAAGGDTALSWAQSVLSPASSLLTFNAAPNTTANIPASFQEPCRLLYNFPAGSNADSPQAQCKFTLDALGPVADPTLATYDAPQDGKTIIGFFGGKCWTGPWNADSGNGNADIPGNCLTSGYASTNDVQLTLQYQDPATSTWITYDVLGQMYASTVQTEGMSTVDNADMDTRIRAFLCGFRSDPRTERWGQFTMKAFPLATDPTGVASPSGNQIHTGASIYRMPQGTTLSPSAGTNTSFVYRLNRNASGTPLVDWRTTIYPGELAVNISTGTTSGATAFIPGGKFFYNDPDHVLRRANGGYMNSTTASPNSNGLPMAKGNYASRPVVLNRPFRSVAEMGHVFSDTPWRDINFFAPESGDAALLDAFCINELSSAPASMVAAGRVNLNTRQPRVLAAIIRGVSKAEGGVLSDDEADRAAAALIARTTDFATATAGILTKGPLRNRAELVGKFISAVTYANTPTSSNTPNIGYDGSKSYAGFSADLTGGTGGIFTTAPDAVIKRRRECVLRALADAGNTRTWNLMIDVVAQVGRYPSTATTLSQFLVEGETRYWVHIAIDRYTGQVIAQQWEPVAE